jgi:hypothetical protein
VVDRQEIILADRKGAYIAPVTAASLGSPTSLFGVDGYMAGKIEF